MRKNFSKLFFICTLTFLSNSYSQTGEIKVGATSLGGRTVQGGFYDYSDPETINITVSVWGYVKYSGKYIVPVYCSVKDLISYAGGPNEDSNLDDLRLYKVLKDSTRILYKFNYNDLLWSDEIKEKKEILPKLEVGDILIVPGEPRMFFSDYFTMTLSVISTLISLAILAITIINK